MRKWQPDYMRSLIQLFVKDYQLTEAIFSGKASPILLKTEIDVIGKFEEIESWFADPKDFEPFREAFKAANELSTKDYSVSEYQNKVSEKIEEIINRNYGEGDNNE